MGSPRKLRRFAGPALAVLSACLLWPSYGCGQGGTTLNSGSLKSLREMAEQGDARAQADLGFMYDNGKGVPQDSKEAVKWYTKAAEQGNVLAQNNLGVNYDQGKGVPEDFAEAIRWFRKAAEQGDPRGQYNLGLMYLKGRGVPQDHVQAHMWINLAASRATGEDQKSLAEVRESLSRKMQSDQIAEAQRRARKWKPKSSGDKGAGPMK